LDWGKNEPAGGGGVGGIPNRKRNQDEKEKKRSLVENRDVGQTLTSTICEKHLRLKRIADYWKEAERRKREGVCPSPYKRREKRAKH